MTIGERIKARRISLKMTQEDVAQIVDVTKQTVQKYENNIISNIPSDKIELLAKALNVSPAYLMGWENKIDISKAESIADIADALQSNSQLFKLVKDIYDLPDDKQKLIQNLVDSIK